ncbi:hypothetical protein VP01_1679g10, partial [Puccinia sorghi]
TQTITYITFKHSLESYNGGTLSGLSSVHKTLVQSLNITLKKPNTVNISKNLLSKCCFVSKMANVPADFLILTAHRDSGGVSINIKWRSFARSMKNTRAECFLHDVNDPHFSLIPVIIYHSIIAIDVKESTVNQCQFEFFLKLKPLERSGDKFESGKCQTKSDSRETFVKIKPWSAIQIPHGLSNSPFTLWFSLPYCMCYNTTIVNISSLLIPVIHLYYTLKLRFEAAKLFFINLLRN